MTKHLHVSRRNGGVPRLFSRGLVLAFTFHSIIAAADELIVTLDNEKEDVSMRTVCDLKEIALGAQQDRSAYAAEEDIREVSQFIPSTLPERLKVIEILVAGLWLKEGRVKELIEVFQKVQKKFPKRNPELLARITVALRFYEQEHRVLSELNDYEKATDGLWEKLALFTIIFKMSPTEAIEGASEFIRHSGNRIHKDDALSLELIRKVGGISMHEMLRRISFSKPMHLQKERLHLEITSEQKFSESDQKLFNRDALFAHWSHHTTPSSKQVERKVKAMLPDLSPNYYSLMHLNEALVEIASDPKADPCQGGGFKVWIITGGLSAVHE